MPNDQRSSWQELERVLPLREAQKLTSVSRYSLVRNYPQYVVQVSPRRRGIKLKHALAITEQTLASRPPKAKGRSRRCP